MKDYLIIYKNGNSERVFAPDRNTLIEEHFAGNVEQFKNDVKLLEWNTLSVQYREDPQSGKINAEISTADANPYGWRV